MKEHPEWLTLNKEDQLRKLVNLQNCQDLQFLNCVIQEALRFEPPVPGPSSFEILEDIKAGGYNFSKGTVVLFWIDQINKNSKQW